MQTILPYVFVKWAPPYNDYVPGDNLPPVMTLDTFQDYSSAECPKCNPPDTEFLWLKVSHVLVWVPIPITKSTCFR